MIAETFGKQRCTNDKQAKRGVGNCVKRSVSKERYVVDQALAMVD